MKKTYEAPTVERVEFKYRDQVVAASGGHNPNCEKVWMHTSPVDGTGCDGQEVQSWNN